VFFEGGGGGDKDQGVGWVCGAQPNIPHPRFRVPALGDYFGLIVPPLNSGTFRPPLPFLRGEGWGEGPIPII